MLLYRMRFPSVFTIRALNCASSASRTRCHWLMSSRCCSNTVANGTRKPDWNRAVSDAEKIVGYPTSYLTLRSLFSDEMSNIAIHLRKLVGSSHPLLKTAKRLIYNGRNNMQTRGLIVLLMSKAAGQLNMDGQLEKDNTGGVSQRQRSLAEITEMIHTAHLIHKGVVNLDGLDLSDGTTLKDMEFGNKLAILSGDYLLANACTGLAALRNTHVVELISTAISDFMEAEFIGERDVQGNPFPDKTFTVENWREKNYLAAGSLMAKSCKATVLLGGHGEETQERAFEFGKQLALAWQVHSDLQPFVDLQRHPPGTSFDLSSLPVILHLQKDLSIIDIVKEGGDVMENSDFKAIHKLIIGGDAIDATRTLLLSHASQALEVLKSFEMTDARLALANIANALLE